MTSQGLDGAAADAVPMTADSFSLTGHMRSATGTRAKAARIARLALAGLTMLAAGACARPDWTDPETSKASRALPPPPAKPAIPSDPGAPPAPPAWVAPLLGKPLRTAFPRDGVCVGNTDGVVRRYAGPPGGARVVGWAWEFAAKAPVPRVVIVGAAGTIIGGAESGALRADVPSAVPAVTSKHTGWEAVSPQTTGRVEVFGVVEAGRAICPLAGVEL